MAERHPGELIFTLQSASAKGPVLDLPGMHRKFRFGSFELTSSPPQLMREGTPVPLRPRPLALLRVLAERPRQVVGKAELLELAWPGLVVEENNLQVQVSVLRKLLGAESIATVSRIGYRFTLPVEEISSAAEPARQDTAARPRDSDTPGGRSAKPATDSALSELIGRASDVAVIIDRLRRSRLVTLAGPGGIGKTRLAREILARTAADFSDGCLWIDLAPIADGALVPNHTLGAVRVATASDDSSALDPIGALSRELGTRQVLLAFDNAEHVLDAVADLCVALLEAAPNVRILVTSQASLHIEQECIVRIEPLALPPANAPMETAATYGAVALFVSRASASDHRFELDASTLPRVLEICRRLDGIPLALELAAARLPGFGLGGVASRLDERFRLLTQSHRRAPDRQQTLQAVFDWSFGLLSPVEKVLFRRLGTLTGAFDLEVAVAIALDPPDAAVRLLADSWQVLDAISVLVDRSLVAMNEADPPQYTLLETGRLYALSMLQASGETAVIERASRWYEERGDTAASATHAGEALRHYSTALELLKVLPADPARQANELDLSLKLGPAVHATLGPTHPRAVELYQRSVQLARGGPSDERAFKALWGYWHFLSLSGRDREATAYADEMMQIARSIGDQGLLLEAEHARMTTRDLLGDAPAVVEAAHTIRSMYRREQHHQLTFAFGGHDPGVCALGQGALNLWLVGRFNDARGAAAETIAFADTLDHGYSRALGYWYAAMTYACLGETRPLAHAADALQELSRSFDLHGLLMEGRLFRARADHELSLFDEPGSNSAGCPRGNPASPDAAIDQMRRVLSDIEASGDLGFTFLHFSLLAGALLDTGAIEEAERLLERAIGYSARGQALFLPELHRLRGEALRKKGDLNGAASTFRRARAVAAEQGALALELRAELSLAGLPGDADTVGLANVLARFASAEDGPDLGRARSFLAQGNASAPSPRDDRGASGQRAVAQAPVGEAKGATGAPTRLRQRLAAVLAADAAGYSRMMSQDEHGTVQALDAARRIFREHIQEHGGKVVDMPGDFVLATFETAVGAVRAAHGVQGELEGTAAGNRHELALRFRIGLHLGDLMEKDDGTIYGDGVNIAARLQALAAPGEVTVSESIHSAVRGKQVASFEDLGEQQVKNIPYPVRAYRMVGALPGAAAVSGAPPALERDASCVVLMKIEITPRTRLDAAHDTATDTPPDAAPNAWQAVIIQKLALLAGRSVGMSATGTLAEFDDPVVALRCAVEIRTAVAGAAEGDRPVPAVSACLELAHYRGSRSEALESAISSIECMNRNHEPGDILVGEMLFKAVQRRSPFIFEDIGQRTLAAEDRAIRVFRLTEEKREQRMQVAPTRDAATREKRPSSIAVLPFKVIGGDDEQRFLAEGITDELIVELGRFRRLFVISRSASFALAEATTDPVTVGKRLSVRHVLEGQVRRIGDSIRIVLTLSETESGTVVWCDKMTRNYADLVSLLDETTARIAATVAGRIQDAGMVALRRKAPSNMTAFECLLKGMDHHRLGGVTETHVREAVSWFDKAIAADPDYAAAYAWRVCAASNLPDFDFAAGERDIRRALELDPCDPETHRILAHYELFHDHHEEAAALMRRAMELNPTDAYIKARCAGISTFVGQAEQSLALLDDAESLDPFLPVWCIEERGVALYALGRHEQALEAHGRLAFQTYRSRLYRAASLVALGKVTEANALIREALATYPNLSTASVIEQERFRDPGQREALAKRLQAAGLPERQPGREPESLGGTDGN